MGRVEKRNGFGFEVGDVIGFIEDLRGQRRGTRMVRVLKAIIDFFCKGKADFPGIMAITQPRGRM